MENTVIRPLGKSLYTKIGIVYPFIFGMLLLLVTKELWPDPFDMFLPGIFTIVFLGFGILQFKQTVTLSHDELVISMPLANDHRIRLPEVTSLWHSVRGWTFYNRGYRYHRLSYTYDNNVVHDIELFLWDKEDITTLITKICELYPNCKSR